MQELRETEAFARWLEKLRDAQARARVLMRIQRLLLGNAGDVAPVGEGVSELRINYGPGYRVYFAQRRESTFLLVGGTKQTQERDIRVAIRLAKKLGEAR